MRITKGFAIMLLFYSLVGCVEYSAEWRIECQKGVVTYKAPIRLSEVDERKLCGFAGLNY